MRLEVSFRVLNKNLDVDRRKFQVLIQQVVWKFTLLIFHIRARPKGLIFMRRIKESRYIECM